MVVKKFHLNKTHNRPDWQPLVSPQGLEARANLYKQVREFFASRNVLEVETPIIQSSAVTDPYIESIHARNINSEFYLQTSPEYSMKRLLAFYKRDIYQLCKVFRVGESGRYHHFEFTMLEWYRVDWSYHELMQEVNKLIKFLSKDKIKLAQTVFTSYQDIFIKYCEIDPLQANQSDYIRACQLSDISPTVKLSDQEYQELLLDQTIAPQLPQDQLTFIYDFPIQQAALAKINENGVAERFELYIGAIELANGFQELTDADEQLERFKADNRKRQLNNRNQIDIDKKFIAALQAGLPESAGVALGIDRLLMLLLGVGELKEVLAFPNL